MTGMSRSRGRISEGRISGDCASKSYRGGVSQRARICSDRRKKEHMFLAMMIVPVCLIFFAMTMTACNQNVKQSNADNMNVIKSKNVDVVNIDIKIQ